MSVFARNPSLGLIACRVSRKCLPSVRSQSSLLDQETQLPIYRRKVQICGQLYQQYRENGWRRYRDAPKEGITAEIECYDNKYIVGNSAASNVLIFTGVPSSFAPFVPLVKHLSTLGVRVIMPKFPDMKLTRESKYFRHSPQEKVELVKALLQPTEIKSFDLLLNHSIGVYAAIQQWKDPEGPRIRSLGMLNPLPADLVPTIRPLWLTKPMLKMYETRFQPFMQKGAHSVLKAMGNTFAGNAFDTMVLAGFSIHYAHVYEYKQEFELLRHKRVPLLIAFSDNDRMVPIKLTKETIKTFGVQMEKADIYDQQGKLQSKGVRGDWINMLRFKSGGHLTQLKYPLIINNAVEQHLQRMKRHVAPDIVSERDVDMDTIYHKGNLRLNM